MAIGMFVPVDIGYLKFHWGTAYEIRRLGAESWVAVRRDGKGQIRADSAENLLYGIRADYQSRPVPRDIGRED